MKIFRNKILVKIIASICIFLTLLNFSGANTVYADDLGWGGLLIKPATRLLNAISDGIITLLHQSVQDQDPSIIKISGKPDWWKDFGSRAFGVITFLGLLFVAVVTVGVGAVSLVALGAIEIVSLIATGDGAISNGTKWIVESSANKWFDEDILLPAFTITPEEIFANKITVFDINFFKPNNGEKEIKTTYIEDKTTFKEYCRLGTGQVLDNEGFGSHLGTTESDQPFETAEKLKTIVDDYIREEGLQPLSKTNNEISICYYDLANYNINIHRGKYYEEFEKILDTYMFEPEDPDREGFEREAQKWLDDKLGFLLDKFNTVLIQKLGKTQNETYMYKTCQDALILKVRYSEGSSQTINGEIIDNQIKYEYILQIIDNDLNAERVSCKHPVYTVEINTTNNKATTTSKVEVESTAQQLTNTVSKWYFILRNLALLVLMLVLIYVGIRIVTGSTAGQKAKYKERLIDWLVAVCLVFIMQYIMTFAIFLSEKLVELLDSVNDVAGTMQQIELSEDQYKSITSDDAEINLNDYEGTIKEINGKHYLYWKTDLMGKMKIVSQEYNEGTIKWVAFSLCYIILVLQTLFFSWTYLRRVVYMAFLTMISPLVAMTYPIDKITDGKAQAFDTWLKEYIFNLLIQPVHLLLYTVLLSSAYELTIKNPLYSIAAIGFMMPAEKLLRKFFGFDKAQTPGLLGGAAGAAMTMTGLQRMMKFGQRASSKKGKEKGSNENIRYAKSNALDEKAAIAQGAGKSKKAVPAGTEGKAEGEKVKTKDNPKPDTGGPATTAATPNSAGVARTQGPKKAEPTNTRNKTQTPNKTKGKKAKETKGKRKLRSTAKAATLAYGRSLKGKAIKAIKKKGPKALIKGAAGLAGGALGAATFGMAGLALGVASGDPTKAGQYTAAGIAGGYGAGKGIAGSTVEAFSVDGKKFKDDVELAWYGDDYKAAQIEKEKKAMIKDEDNVQYIRKVLNVPRHEAQQILENTGGACFDAGITDIEDIAAVYKMTNENKKVGIKQAMAAQKWNKYLPSDLNKMNSKDRDDYIAKWAKEFEEYEDPEYLASETMKLAELFNKAKAGLPKA